VSISRNFIESNYTGNSSGPDANVDKSAEEIEDWDKSQSLGGNHKVSSRVNNSQSNFEFISETAQHAVENSQKESKDSSSNIEVILVVSAITILSLLSIVDAATNNSKVEELNKGYGDHSQALGAVGHHIHVDEGEDEGGSEADED
jgi:hypothetical protein